MTKSPKSIRFLEFEKPIAELESKIQELRHLSNSDSLNILEEINRLETKLHKILHQTYSNLNPWQKVQVARHPDRPKFQDYCKNLIHDFIPLAGDRAFGEDAAIIGGPGRFRNRQVMIIGQEKGDSTENRIKHNFGMPKPEGYRKSKRLMELADQFSLPIITFVDTAGAYPGIDAEERGQSEAIARSIETSLKVKVPIISIIIGEGGSGGAIAIATGNKIFMLEHSIYSVISPEGCASILWKSGTKAPEASEAQRLTAQDLLSFHIIDEIISEPLGGAQRNPIQMVNDTGNAIEKALNELLSTTLYDFSEERSEKFIKMGRFN